MQDKNVVKYQAKDGQEITLTFDTVKKYLVQGNSDAVTHQEIMYFLGVCKSRGLNPFKKDCYLIKYGKDPAAIITSIDYFRSRARAQKDCKGWECGIIVKTTEGKIKDTYGLLLDGETLLGGWFESKPEGWTTSKRLEVNLNGYIKKTKDGKITHFWRPEMQPTMISKVAEGQGLRQLWPDEFQGLYEESEVTPEGFTVDMASQDGSHYEPGAPSFDSQIPEGTDSEMLDKWVSRCAAVGGIAAEKVEAEAVNDPGFWRAFDIWLANQQDEGEGAPVGGDAQTEALKHKKEAAAKTESETDDAKVIKEIKASHATGFRAVVRLEDWNNRPKILEAIKVKHLSLFKKPFDPAAPLDGLFKDTEEKTSKPAGYIHCDEGGPYDRPVNPMVTCVTCKVSEGCNPYAEYVDAQRGGDF